jgi:parallel beta-helix repeat protein
MSLIKANAVQVGQSPTATQNFTLAVPSSPDGTIKLARGNSGATTQDVMNVSNAGVVSFPQGLGNISNSTAIATGSTTARSLANRFADVVNVKDFGAVGDGVTDDTAAIQAAINASLRVEFAKGGVYKITGPINITSTGTQIIGNGARITGAYEQNPVSPSYSESFFNVTGADDVLFENIRLQYTGTFTIGGLDYGGYISGIHIEDSDRFTARGVEAYGFNRAGINVAMNASYCANPLIVDCYLHHNRVSGLIFGNTNNGTMQNCNLAFNGIVSSVGTGYGFSGWSACLPKNTILANNQANDNYRKGIDFHAGENGTIIGNTCSRNRIYGIYVMGTIGSWTITGNTVTDMSWANEFPASSPYGIRVGDLIGQGIAQMPTSFVINGNVISKINKTAGSIFPLGDSMVGCSYGKLIISNNIIDVQNVSRIHDSANGVTGVEGNYYDISITGNQIKASNCDSIPIYIRSGKNRQKIFSNNTLEIDTITTTSGVVIWDNTSITNNCFIGNGNSIDAPSLSWSSVFDPISVKRVTAEKMNNNIVNGSSWRDWDGYKFIESGITSPVSNYWTQGSILWDTNSVASGFAGFYCTVTGTPGTWKTFGAISA